MPVNGPSRTCEDSGPLRRRRWGGSRVLAVVVGWVVVLLAGGARAWADPPEPYDVVVYGGTAGGVAAAVQAAEMGKSVVLIEPTQRLGGMTTNGLSRTDTGKTDAIQGLAREFYTRVGQEYGGSGPEWTFEPHVAERVLDAWVVEAGVTVVRGERLDLDAGVAKAGSVIETIRMESGRMFAGGVFIDAAYEGDLLAKAGVSYTVGRESNATYGETYNGVQTARATSHQFGSAVDPYVVPGNPSSGLLPYVGAGPPGVDGQGDHRVQAYNFRLTVTRAADRRPWTAPADYDAGNYELLRRHIAASNPQRVTDLMILSSLRGGKYDMNNRGAVSTDFIGMNYEYPDGDHETREQIIAAHRSYQQGLLYFLATDPSVPQHIRDEMNGYGLTQDEFPENDGWSGTLYVREARRMIGRYVMTDRDCLAYRDAPEPVALGSYNMDSHNAQRYVTAGGLARNEGDIQKSVPEPYEISYMSLTPVEEEVSNLLVTGAVSASHIAYGSIRMEPVFMSLGQAAGTAAVLALDGGTSVQDVDYLALRTQLIDDGALVQWPNNGVLYRGVVAEDFNDLTGLPRSVRYSEGGVGFDGAWDGTNTESVHAGDLAYGRGGYAVVQGGSGTPGALQAHYFEPRQNNRSLAGEMGGEIWFSVLLHSPDDGSVGGLTFNPTGNADPASDSIRHGVQLAGGELRVVLDGEAVGVATGLALNETHLLLGRLVLRGGADTLSLWVDPADLTDPGPADFHEAEADLFDLLGEIAVYGYNPEGPFNQPWRTDGGIVDAVRLSNREPAVVAYQDVTGVVPEPASAALLASGAWGVLLCSRARGRGSRRSGRRGGGRPAP